MKAQSAMLAVLHISEGYERLRDGVETAGRMRVNCGLAKEAATGLEDWTFLAPQIQADIVQTDGYETTLYDDVIVAANDPGQASILVLNPEWPQFMTGFFRFHQNWKDFREHSLHPPSLQVIWWPDVNRQLEAFKGQLRSWRAKFIQIGGRTVTPETVPAAPRQEGPLSSTLSSIKTPLIIAGAAVVAIALLAASSNVRAAVGK